MRISLVLLLCVFVVVVSSATTKLTTRRVVSTTKRGTTKSTVRKSAYAYLRSVRGKNSCAGGSCPFWERHGRSFAALRCYSQQYQECTCLHRMCFSSCMFSREVCNAEMVMCLKQICPRCIPSSAAAMCAVYDSMAVQVANALSVFACYPCCPNLSNTTTTGIPPLTLTITLPQNNQPATTPVITTTGQLTNGPGTNGQGTNGQGTNGQGTNGQGTNGQGTNGQVTNGQGTNGQGTNGQGTNGQGTNGQGTNGGGNNGQNNGANGVFPGSQGAIGPFPTNAGNAGANTNANANSGNSATNNNNNNNTPIRSQRVQSTVRPTTRRVVTTRRTSATTRRAGQAATTARGNPIKSGAAKPVQNQKKPQTNNGIKS